MPHSEGNPPRTSLDVKDPFLPPRLTHPSSGGVWARLRMPRSSPAVPATSTTANARTSRSLAEDERGGEEAAFLDQRDEARSQASVGSLVVVGTGIMAVNHMTIEALRWIKQSDKILFFGVDPVTERWIRKLNANVASLNSLGHQHKSALQTGNEIVERTLEYVRAGLSVCAAYCGRSAVCAYAPYESIKRCRAEGYRAAMAPGVSVEDCLFADLGLDPMHAGCQIYESTDFLARRRQLDTSAGLILWFVGCLGDTVPDDNAGHFCCHSPLVEALVALYGAEHEVILYEPARYSVCDPIIQRYTIGQLGGASVTAMSSLIVPPKEGVAANPRC
jgi:hypothetical protein